MTTTSNVLNVNIILTSVNKHVHDAVRYKVIPCQLTNDTSSVLLPMAEHCSCALHLNAQYMRYCGRLSC